MESEYGKMRDFGEMKFKKQEKHQVYKIIKSKRIINYTKAKLMSWLGHINTLASDRKCIKKSINGKKVYKKVYKWKESV